jgi:hypothetical protein
MDVYELLEKFAFGLSFGEVVVNEMEPLSYFLDHVAFPFGVGL